MKRFNLPKSARLLKSAEFDRVFRARCSASDDRLIVYCAWGPQEWPRLGLTVSRKVGNAVERNRWKRALREAFRLVQHQLPRHVDLIVLPCRGATPDGACLQSSLRGTASSAASKLPRVDIREEEPT